MVLPNEGVKIAEEGSLLIMDIVVQLGDGSIANVECQKNGYAFPVIVNGRPEESIDFAKKHGVVCRRSFTKSVGIHYQERFDLFPNAVAALNRGLSFPLYPFLSQKDTEALNKVLSHLP